MIMPFYSKMYEKFPYDEENPFHFDDKKEEKPINKSLDEMIWDLGLTLPSWDDED